MKEFKDQQEIYQFEKKRGGYCYLKIDASTIEQFEKKSKTRLICAIDKFEFQCGVNHYGDGSFYIILSKKNLKNIRKKPGDEVEFVLREDPNPLGVEMPETLEVLLEQDPELSKLFEKFTPGKKRSVIHEISRIKDIDRQIARSIDLIKNPRPQRRKKE